MTYLNRNYTPLAIAHRGGAAEAPENTMKAFEYTVGLGFKYIETDIRMTKDKVLVIYHDKSVDRLTEGRGKVSSLTWKQISKLRVDGEPIPRLEEVLESFPDVYWNLDPKQPACVPSLARLINDFDIAENICVGSLFSYRQKQIRRLVEKETVTSASLFQVFKIKLASFKKPSVDIKELRQPRELHRPPNDFELLQFPLKFHGVNIVNEKFIQTAHQLGLHVHIWTKDEAKIMEQLLDWGVDGLITDVPSILKQILIDRNLWSRRE